MKKSIGDLVLYRGKKAIIQGFRSNGDKELVVIEIYNHPNLFNMLADIDDNKKEIISVDEKELKVLQSVWDHFFILKFDGQTIPFTSKQELAKAITPKNFNKAEIYEIKKLGKPQIIVPIDMNGNQAPAGEWL